jgi:hypothetical protein
MNTPLPTRKTVLNPIIASIAREAAALVAVMIAALGLSA